MDLKDYIRDIPDFPRPGILFRDITPLLKDPEAFRQAIDGFADQYVSKDFDGIIGIEARGFLFAAPLAHRLRKPLLPVRKQGKLPFETHAVSYSLEYGSDVVEVHRDAVVEGHKILVVDDLLATGGTLAATAALVEKAGGHVAGLAVLIELTDLDGRERLQGYNVYSQLRY